MNSLGPQLANLEVLPVCFFAAESVASSTIEGLEVGIGHLARAEAAKEAGGLGYQRY